MKYFQGRLLLVSVVVLFLSQTQSVRANTTTIGLTEAACLRIEAISFFVLLGTLSALGMKQVWNSFKRDFPNLPELTFRKAIGFSILSGLLFLIVQTTLSGFRISIVQGGWDKLGLTSQSTNKETSFPSPEEVAELRLKREKRISTLALALLSYAADHQGKFPATKNEIPSELWTADEISSAEYVYTAGLNSGDKEKILVYEPAIFGDKRFLLHPNGEILEENWEQRLASQQGSAPP